MMSAMFTSSGESPPIVLDYLAAQAAKLATPDTPIASHPEVFCAGKPSHIQEWADRFDINRFVDFAAGAHSADPSRLSAMAIRLTSRGSQGFSYAEPQVVDGQVRYPLIDIRLGVLRPLANHSLRHEIRHAFQPNTRPLYTYRGVDVAVRMAGLALGAASFVPENPGVWGSEQAVIAGLRGLGAGALIGGSVWAWVCSPREWDAERFAWQTRSFKPFQ